MATRPKPGGWTYAEFAGLPTDGNRYEVIAGELYVTPAPRPHHQRAVLQLAIRLETFAREHDLGWVLQGPIDVLFAEGDYLEPDLVFVRRERRGIISDRGIEAAPDLVVEVLSEATGAQDRGVKRARYAYFGVSQYWIVDLDARAIEVYRLQEDPEHPAVVGDALTWQPIPGGPTLTLCIADVVAGFPP